MYKGRVKTMEKIYEEKKQKQSLKQIKVDGTSALSFLVAIFAIVSLVSFGVSGGLNTSYALPAVTTVPTDFQAQEDVLWYANGSQLREVDLHFGKKDGNWSYGWIPAVAPICGGVVASLLYNGLAAAGMF